MSDSGFSIQVDDKIETKAIDKPTLQKLESLLRASSTHYSIEPSCTFYRALLVNGKGVTNLLIRYSVRLSEVT